MKDKILPSWLQNVDPYQPRSDQDRFLHSSIQRILHLLSSLQQSRTVHRNTHPLVAFLHAISMVAMIVMVHLVQYLYLILPWILLQVAMMPALWVRRIIVNATIVAGLHFIVLSPAVWFFHQTYSYVLVMKTWLCVAQMQVLAITLPWHEWVQSLRWLRVPSVMIFIIHMTIKYLYVLGRLALQLLYALQLRSIGCNDDKTTSVGSIMAVLYWRSLHESKRLHQAMVLRGFDGTYQFRWNGRWHMQDAIYVGITIFYWYSIMR